MFADFLRRLTAPTKDVLDETDARRAIGALLVRIAKSDGHYAPEEIARIDRILANRFDLNVVEAAKLRAECEGIEAEAPDTVRFTRAIKDAVSLDDREAIVRAMWQVVMTDGHRDQNEDALMRMVAPLLGLTDQDSNRIRIELSQS
ncbi:hypothetical protein BVC71_11420 [Marivivens niveibacter]|uniref:Co-chaperone DjlA N-terminal domain-containing protein n=1 Tax=Marivivens niveibacter TaxID=1930667 RepID=A0A251WYU6_9RHOB|nr:TerB family tellurite resistance protein [Marivivens niveibacter]OUD09298.1 hypothetical protein BVC71_11420 [Marivivens niveibacter]